MSKRRKNRIVENIEITDIGATGKAVGKKDNIVYFVDGAIPGDIVDVLIKKKKDNYCEAKIKTIHKYSEKRIDAFCSHFGACGGCKWQNLSYKDQVEFKQNYIIENIKRIGKIENLPEIDPFLKANETEYYRNKLEFAFCNYRWLTNQDIPDKDSLNLNGLGFHVAGLHDRVVDVEHCYLQAEPSNKIRLAVKDFCDRNNLEYFNTKTMKGFMRNLMIRTTTTGEVMVLFSFYREEKENRINLLEFIKNKFPEITSLMYVINPKGNDTIFDLDIELYDGKPYIIEEMEGLKFKIGPKSFFQTNSKQAFELYKSIRNFAGLTGNEIVYDLYTGTGSIAQFVSKKAAVVVGIEIVPDAIIDAKINAEINNITNTHFYAGDMKDVFNKELIDKYGFPDVVITDPPRAGMHQSVIDLLLEIKPRKIVYVSCNPSTQARDLSLMKDVYKLTKIQGVDMFPHTYHAENIVLLEL